VQNRPERILIVVTTGLEPVVHADGTKERHGGKSQKRRLCMDCRVKPGNDVAEEQKRNPPYGASFTA